MHVAWWRRVYEPPGRSCLFANTSSSASFISRSWMMRASSVRASSIRALSLESITKMRPWVPVRTSRQHVIVMARLAQKESREAVRVQFAARAPAIPGTESRPNIPEK